MTPQRRLLPNEELPQRLAARQRAAGVEVDQLSARPQALRQLVKATELAPHFLPQPRRGPVWRQRPRDTRNGRGRFVIRQGQDKEAEESRGPLLQGRGLRTVKALDL